MSEVGEERMETGTSLKRAGFTLMEMMVVIGLAAVIASIAVPAFTRARQESRIAQARAELDILAAALKRLAWDTGAWPAGLARSAPTSAETWDLTTGAAGLLSNDGRFSDWQGPYVSEVPLDPWGSPYFFDPDYRIDGQNRIVVGSFGPNRRGRNLYDADDLYVRLE